MILIHKSTCFGLNKSRSMFSALTYRVPSIKRNVYAINQTKRILLRIFILKKQCWNHVGCSQQGCGRHPIVLTHKWAQRIDFVTNIDIFWPPNTQSCCRCSYKQIRILGGTPEALGGVLHNWASKHKFWAFVFAELDKGELDMFTNKNHQNPMKYTQNQYDAHFET